MAKDVKTPAVEEEQPMDRQALEAEKKKLRSDKKQQKKEAKKRARELAEQESSLGDEESGGALTFLVTIAIVAVWLGIICVVIKLDVGGFGSGVLAPLLKDVPVVNKILPEEKQPVPDDGDGAPENPEGYTLEEALARISQLEAQLEQAQGGTLSKDEEIASLKAENARLQEFEDAQVEFQRIKTEFFEDVIYAENGPGPEEFRKYYEEMDPTTAEYLYKQVVKQLEESSEFQEYADSFVAMKPKSAAAVLEQMTDNMDLVARILNALSASDRAAILQSMTPEVAAKLLKSMDPES